MVEPVPVPSLSKPRITQLFETQPKPGAKKFAFLNEPSKLLYAQKNGTVSIYNMSKNQGRSIFEHKDADFTDLAVSPSNDLVAFSFENIPFVIGNYRKGLFTRREFNSSQRNVLCLDFSAEGSHLVTGSLDKSVKYYNTGAMRFESSFIGHKNRINCVRCSNFDRDILVSGSDDGTVKMWDMRCRSIAETFQIPHKGSLPSLKDLYFSDSGKALIAVSNNVIDGVKYGNFQIFDVRNSNLLQFYTESNAKFECLSLQFKPGERFKNAKLAAIYDSNKACHILDLEIGSCMVKMSSEWLNNVQHIQFSPENPEHLYMITDKSNFLIQWNIPNDPLSEMTSSF